jgi:hypothetical protein
VAQGQQVVDHLQRELPLRAVVLGVRDLASTPPAPHLGG